MNIKINHEGIEYEIPESEIEKFKVKKEGKWRPCENEEYTRLYTDSSTNITRFTEFCDAPIWNFGNGYFTKKSAQKERAWRQARQRIRDFIRKNSIEVCSEEEVIDDSVHKYFLSMYETRIAYRDAHIVYQSYNFFFKSEMDRNYVAENCEEDLIIFLTTPALL